MNNALKVTLGMFGLTILLSVGVMSQSGIFAKNPELIVIGSEAKWVLERHTGVELQYFTTDITALNNKNAKICLYPKVEMTTNDQIVIDARAYLFRNNVKTGLVETADFEKEIERGKLKKMCLNVDANLIDKVQFGQNSIVYVYQESKLINYNLGWSEVNVTLFKNVSGSFTNQINDIWVFTRQTDNKFGANDTNNIEIESYKYIINSTVKINSNGLRPFISRTVYGLFSDMEQMHIFDFSDICMKNLSAYSSEPNCVFNFLGEKTLEVTFNSDKNIDPTVYIVEMNGNAMNKNVTVEVNFSHLNVSTTAPYDKLYIYYPFDADNLTGTLTTAYDFSPNNNDGTYTVRGQLEDGIFGYAVNTTFAGDSIDMPTIAINVSETGITMLAWMKINIVPPKGAYSSNGYARIYEDVSNSMSFLLVREADNDLGLHFNAKLGGVSVNSIASSATDEWDGKWTMVTYVNNRTHSLWYINGVEADADAHSGTQSSIDFSSSANDIGISANVSIDDFMIFSTNLTASQVLDIYNNQSARYRPVGYQTFKQFNVTTSSGWINVSETKQQNMLSTIKKFVGVWSSTNGYNESDFQRDYYMNMSNAGMSAYYSNYVMPYPPFSMYSTTDFSLDYEAYFDSQSSVSGQRRTLYTNGLYNYCDYPYWYWTSGLTVYYMTGTIFIVNPNLNSTSGGNAYCNAYTATSYTITENAWHHIAVTYDGNYSGNNGLATLYIDGTSRLSYQSPFILNGATNAIGGMYWGQALNYTNMSIDNLRFYNKTLSSTEITELYGNMRSHNNTFNNINLTNWWMFDKNTNDRLYGASMSSSGTPKYSYDNDFLVAYFHFDEPYWDTTVGQVNDSVGNYDCTSVGDTTTILTNYPFNRVGTFDGTGDYVNCGDVLDMRYNNITISLWVRKKDTGSYAGLVAKTYSISSYAYAIMFDSSGTLRAHMADDAGSGDVDLYTSKNYADALWHHIVLVYDRSKNMTIYVDSKQDGTKDISSLSAEDIEHAYTLQFGAVNAGYALNGEMDEVMIFNKTLSESEIKELYIKGRALFTEAGTYQSSDIFNIGTYTTNVLLTYQQNAGTNNFYSPILATNQNLNISVDETNKIDVCTTLNQPNTVFYLGANITDNTLTSPCITISGSNITLDCNGFNITSTSNYPAVLSSKNDTTIRNCMFKMGNSAATIYMQKAWNFSIYNNTIFSTFDITTGNLTFLDSCMNGTVENNSYFDGARGVYLSNTKNTTVKFNNMTGIRVNAFDLKTSSSYNSFIGNNIENNTNMNAFNLQSGVSWNKIENNTAMQITRLISLSSSQWNTIKRNVASNLTNTPAIAFGSGCHNNNATDNILTNITGVAIQAINSQNLTIKNNSVYDASTMGMYFATNCHYMKIENNAISTCRGTSDIQGCIVMSQMNNISVKGNIISNSSSNGIYMTRTNSTIFTDNIIENSTLNDTFLTGASVNNTFLNTTYNKEWVENISRLTRKWYYRAFVISSGAPADGAYVNGSNVTGATAFNLTTDATGYTNTITIIDYVNDALGLSLYSNYSVVAGLGSLTANHAYNASLGNNLSDVFNLILVSADSTPPQITMVYPSSTSKLLEDGTPFTFFGNATDNTAISGAIFEFNGVNYTATFHGTNWSVSVPRQNIGSYQFRWWFNDTNDNMNVTSFYTMSVITSDSGNYQYTSTQVFYEEVNASLSITYSKHFETGVMQGIDVPVNFTNMGFDDLNITMSTYDSAVSITNGIITLHPKQSFLAHILTPPSEEGERQYNITVNIRNHISEQRTISFTVWSSKYYFMYQIYRLFIDYWFLVAIFIVSIVIIIVKRRRGK